MRLEPILTNGAVHLWMDQINVCPSTVCGKTVYSCVVHSKINELLSDPVHDPTHSRTAVPGRKNTQPKQEQDVPGMQPAGPQETPKIQT